VQLASVTERRLAGLVILAAAAAFVVLIVLAGPFFRTYDESKYVGIGLNVFAGNGPRTAFGVWFQPHSPLWPMVVTAPTVWFGLPSLAWGQVLNALAGAGILAIVGVLGARIRPIVGALAVVAYLGAPYLQDLSRTARLDVPVAFVILAYLLVGFEAVRRDSIGLGLLAGGVVGVAFLIKEIALPMAPVPFLAGILIGRPFSRLARVGAAAALVAAIVTSWWFVMFASITHLVYRLGTSDRLLVPLYIVAAIAIVVGLGAPWLADRPAISRLGDRLAAALPGSLRDGRGRRPLAWGLAGLWFLAFLVFFDRNPELKGQGIVSLGQYRLYLSTWLPAAGGPLILVVLAGLLLAVPARLRLGARAALSFDVIVLALVCSAPLVMLVIAVGEPPRNYLAQIGLMLTLAATGWTYGLLRVVRLPTTPILVGVLALVGAAFGGYVARVSTVVPTVAGAVAGGVLGLALGWRWPGRDWGPLDPEAGAPPTAERSPARLAIGPALVVLAGLALATTSLAVHSVRTRQTGGTAEAQAVAAAATWINEHVSGGDKVGFGSYLGDETSVDMPNRPNLTAAIPTLAVLDPSAPLGLALYNAPPVDDWLAVDISRREREFLVFRASTFAKTVISRRIAYYVYLTGPYTSVPSLLAALTPDHGFTLVSSGTYESVTPTGTKQVVGLHIFAVQADRVGFADAKVGMSPAGLDRLTSLLAADPGTTPATAAALIDRVITYPDPAAAASFLDRLRARAGR
jgi:hypothetical protein